MQGRQGRGKDPWDRTSRDNNDSLNGSGKQRAVPQRPPGMARLDTPPAVQRVARPQRQAKPRRSRGRRLLIGMIVLAIGVMLVFGIAYGIANLFIATSNSAGPANTATDFLLNLRDLHYDLAYKDLDATITVPLHPEDFQKMALADDRCYGPIKDFNEVEGSAIVSGNIQSFTYDMTRSKLTKTYQLTLTLQKDSDGNWDITKIVDGDGTVNDLGPAPPTCQ